MEIAVRARRRPLPAEPRNDGVQPSPAADILSISDKPALAAYLPGLFRSFGWTVAGARTFAAGLSCLRDAAATLGPAAEAPVLVVVGNDPSLAGEVLASGGFDALVRPLRKADVLWTVASASHAWITRQEAGKKGGPRCSDA